MENKTPINEKENRYEEQSRKYLLLQGESGTNYILIKKISQGTFGAVYEAYSEKSEKEYKKSENSMIIDSCDEQSEINSNTEINPQFAVKRYYKTSDPSFSLCPLQQEDQA